MATRRTNRHALRGPRAPAAPSAPRPPPRRPGGRRRRRPVPAPRGPGTRLPDDARSTTRALLHRDRGTMCWCNLLFRLYARRPSRGRELDHPGVAAIFLAADHFFSHVHVAASAIRGLPRCHQGLPLKKHQTCRGASQPVAGLPYRRRHLAAAPRRTARRASPGKCTLSLASRKLAPRAPKNTKARATAPPNLQRAAAAARPAVCEDLVARGLRSRSQNDAQDFRHGARRAGLRHRRV